MRRARIVGAGRAGGSLALALRQVGWHVEGPLGRDAEATDAAADVDLLVLAVPDAAVAGLAALVAPVEGTVVAHLAGARGLAELAPHARRAVLHPLAALPDPERGAVALRTCWWGLSRGGDPLGEEVVGALGGRFAVVEDAERVRYHAAAAMAANHLVALLGSVERVAAPLGVPLEAYLDMAAGALADVVALGPAAALTGPAARGDLATVAAHAASLPDDERPVYDALGAAALRLAATRGAR